MRVGHLADQFRADPACGARLARIDRAGERRSTRTEPPQASGEVVEQVVVEPGAHAADVGQSARRRQSEQQSAECRLAPSMAHRVAADHDLLDREVLDLDPLGGALTRAVGRVQTLGHDALQPHPAACLEQVGTSADEGRGHLPVRPGRHDCLEQLPTLHVREGRRRQAVDGEDVEHEVRGGNGGRELGGPRRRADVHPRRERAEVRPPVRAQHGHLTVEDRSTPTEAPGQSLELRVGDGRVDPGTSDQAYRGRRDLRGHPHAVPFHLVRPAVVLVGVGQPAGDGEHRPEVRHP
jgi:hypothetical protein